IDPGRDAAEEPTESLEMADRAAPRALRLLDRHARAKGPGREGREHGLGQALGDGDPIRAVVSRPRLRLRARLRPFGDQARRAGGDASDELSPVHPVAGAHFVTLSPSISTTTTVAIGSTMGRAMVSDVCPPSDFVST